MPMQAPLRLNVSAIKLEKNTAHSSCFEAGCARPAYAWNCCSQFMHGRKWQLYCFGSYVWDGANWGTDITLRLLDIDCCLMLAITNIVRSNSIRRDYQNDFEGVVVSCSAVTLSVTAPTDIRAASFC